MDSTAANQTGHSQLDSPATSPVADKQVKDTALLSEAPATQPLWPDFWTWQAVKTEQQLDISYKNAAAALCAWSKQVERVKALSAEQVSPQAKC